MDEQGMQMAINLSQYSKIFVLTGAGISADSGLQTYRGSGGIWEEHEVERYGSITAFNRSPADTWRLFGSLREPVLAAEPNAAHLALVQLEKHLSADQKLLLVTQNVDGLHQRAGSKNVINLHGDIMYSKCSNSHCKLARYRDQQGHLDRTPECPLCGSPIRPDIVLFGEDIPALSDGVIETFLQECDLFIAIGTSGTVYPASNFVSIAAYNGARTLLVNLQPMERSTARFKKSTLEKRKISCHSYSQNH